MSEGWLSRKRPRVSEDINSFAEKNNFEIVEDELLASLSDVQAAMAVVLGYMASSQHLPRVVFKHQISTIIKNPTEVERELESMRLSGKVRNFSISLSSSEIMGVMMSDDYTADIETRINECVAGGEKQTEEALRLFKEWISSHTSTTVLEGDILDADSGGTSAGCMTRPILESVVSAGFLIQRRSSAAAGLYALWHPKIGELVRVIDAMSRHIHGVVRRTRYKEVSERSLIASKAKEKTRGKVPRGAGSAEGAGFRYHIADMVGRGLLNKIDGPSGVLLRIPKKT